MLVMSFGAKVCNMTDWLLEVVHKILVKSRCVYVTVEVTVNRKL